MKSLILVVFPPLLAAADGIPGFDWGTISATALLGWYLWYTTKVVFPNHRKEVKEMQDSFTNQFSSQRDHYEVLLEELHDRHDLRHEGIMSTLEKISQKLTESK